MRLSSFRVGVSSTDVEDTQDTTEDQTTVYHFDDTFEMPRVWVATHG